MNIAWVLAVIFSISLGANWLHWINRAQPEFLYFPSEGWLKFVFTIWMVACAVSVPVFFLGWLPTWIFVSIWLGFVIAQELYSVFARERQAGPRR
jgi:hypothetical protein